MNERAIVYRKLNGIPESWGTAVNIQSMVFGNMGEDSGTGVAFTRDAASGENYFYGEFLMNAQGEDVVAGTRTPLPIEQLKAKDPKSHKQLMDIRTKLEKHYRDMMDIEFTIQNRQALHAAVPRRQAHRLRRDQDRGGHGEAKNSSRRRSPHARRARPAQPAAASHLRSEGQEAAIAGGQYC
jgi:phosphoenolpyruvate synthase/pyruvate phosphate dikinase